MGRTGVRRRIVAGDAAAGHMAVPRRAWQRPDLAFLFVQLAGYRDGGTWALLREAQAAALCAPHTGMATAVDIVDAIDIHPRNKRDVGRRLALAARRVSYGRDVASTGPVFTAATREGNRMRVAFDVAAGGLVAVTRFAATGAPLRREGGPKGPPADEPLRGFAVAGTDRRFVAAQARIDGACVRVWHDDIPAPAAVRYNWSDCPDGNLYDAAGLPAQPFRTDDWP
jgi:sialate O-acetylesterase